MTDDDIKRLRQLAAAATPGPWEYRAHPDGAHGVAHPHGWVDVVIGVGESQAPDTRYIAAASPDVILALLAERDALRAMLREARDYVNAYSAHPETDDVLKRIDALLGDA